MFIYQNFKLNHDQIIQNYHKLKMNQGRLITSSLRDQTNYDYFTIVKNCPRDRINSFDISCINQRQTSHSFEEKHVQFEEEGTLTSISKKTSKKTMKKEALEKARHIKYQKRAQYQLFVSQFMHNYEEKSNETFLCTASLPQYKKDLTQISQTRKNLLQREVSCSNFHLTFTKLSTKERQEQLKRLKACKRLQRQLQ